VALRRAGRTAIVMPAMFALGDKVIGNPQLATFAAFGSFAMLLLVDFTGSMRDRVQAQVALAVAGGALVCVGTLASRAAWLAAAAMAVVGFGVLFAGVVSSVLAGATTSLLLAFILPVSLAAPASSIPDRLAGWALASVAALFAVVLADGDEGREGKSTSGIPLARHVGAGLGTAVAGIVFLASLSDAAVRAAEKKGAHVPAVVPGARHTYLAAALLGAIGVVAGAWMRRAPRPSVSAKPDRAPALIE